MEMLTVELDDAKIQMKRLEKDYEQVSDEVDRLKRDLSEADIAKRRNSEKLRLMQEMLLGLSGSNEGSMDSITFGEKASDKIDGVNELVIV